MTSNYWLLQKSIYCFLWRAAKRRAAAKGGGLILYIQKGLTFLGNCDSPRPLAWLWAEQKIAHKSFVITMLTCAENGKNRSRGREGEWGLIFVRLSALFRPRERPFFCHLPKPHLGWHVPCVFYYVMYTRLINDVAECGPQYIRRILFLFCSLSIQLLRTSVLLSCSSSFQLLMTVYMYVCVLSSLFLEAAAAALY